MIRVKRLMAVMVLAAVLFGANGLWAAAPPKPKGTVTFKFTVTGVNQGKLILAVEPVFPAGVAGTWDPDAAAGNAIRLVTDEGGVFLFTTYTPQLQGSGPVPPPPPPPPPPVPSVLHVLIVYDASSPYSMPLEQAAILTSVPVKQYLDSHCAKEKLPDGTLQPAHRFLDTNADVSKQPSDWQAVFKRTAGKPLPWLIIANESGGTFEGPLPASPNGFLAELQKLGGK